MRKLEAQVKEIVDEMGYLQRREMRMRDTNGTWRLNIREMAPSRRRMLASVALTPLAESTNARVKWFAVIITIGIISLGAWQLFHLRSFFKRKYLID